MQHQTTYYRTVPVSEKPKHPDLYHTLIENESLGIEGLPCHNNYIGDPNGGYWEIDGESKVIHYLEPIPIPDAERLREKMQEILQKFDGYIENLKSYMPASDVVPLISEREKLECRIRDHESFTAPLREALSQTGDGWVRVEDRLPEPGKSVLMYWKNSMGFGRISKGFYAAKFSVVDDNEENHDGYSEYSEEKDEYYYPEGWVEAGWETQYSATIKGVTHWQYAPKEPLPPQPIKQVTNDSPMYNMQQLPPI